MIGLLLPCQHHDMIKLCLKLLTLTIMILLAGDVLVPADKVHFRLLILYFHLICSVIYLYHYQPISPKNEKIVSPNPPPDAAITGPVRNVSNQSEALNANQPNIFTPQEQTYVYGG